MFVQCPKPIKVKLDKKYLYDRDNSINELIEVDFIGLALYKDEYPKVVIDLHGFRFYDIPINAIYSLECKTDYKASEPELVYEKAQSISVDIDILPGEYTDFWDKSREYVGTGKYHFSICWIESNQHLSLIEANQFYLWPLHKLRFMNSVKENYLPLPNWKKLHQ